MFQWRQTFGRAASRASGMETRVVGRRGTQDSSRVRVSSLRAVFWRQCKWNSRFWTIFTARFSLELLLDRISTHNLWLYPNQISRNSMWWCSEIACSNKPKVSHHRAKCCRVAPLKASLHPLRAESAQLTTRVLTPRHSHIRKRKCNSQNNRSHILVFALLGFHSIHC